MVPASCITFMHHQLATKDIITMKQKNANWSQQVTTQLIKDDLLQRKDNIPHQNINLEKVRDGNGLTFLLSIRYVEKQIKLKPISISNVTMNE